MPEDSRAMNLGREIRVWGACILVGVVLEEDEFMVFGIGSVEIRLAIPQTGSILYTVEDGVNKAATADFKTLAFLSALVRNVPSCTTLAQYGLLPQP